MFEVVLIADADKSLAEDEPWPVYCSIFGANARLGGRFHGTDGPLHVEDRTYYHELSTAFIEAGVAASLKRNDDCNGADQKGIGPSHGRRGVSKHVAPARSGHPQATARTAAISVLGALVVLGVLLVLLARPRRRRRGSLQRGSSRSWMLRVLNRWRASSGVEGTAFGVRSSDVNPDDVRAVLDGVRDAQPRGRPALARFAPLSLLPYTFC